MRTNFKAFLAMLLALTCLLSVAACGGGSDSENSKDATQAMTESKDTSADTNSSTVDGSSEDNTDSSADNSSAGNDSSETNTDSSAGNDSSVEDSSSTKPEYTDTDENGNAQRDPNYEPLNYETMKGVWISQFDIPTVFKSTNERAYTSSVKRVVKAVAEAGFNTIVLQVRPNGDSYYPSEVYPASEFVTGAYGNDEFKFDALKIFVEVAHDYDISLHAWINPMRLMSTSKIGNVSTDYRVGQWYQEKAPYISEWQGTYYLIPGYEESRQLVCDGIKELASNYNVDAIHIDDYFYPTVADSFDDVHFKPIEDNYVYRKAYRLEMVDTLVKQMYDTVKSVDSDLLFGISPAGSISNNLNSLYANVNKWCSTAGFCDYIAPQVYWGFEHPTDKFDEVCEEWRKICTSDAVKLVIGIGIYRIDTPTGEFQEYSTSKDVTKRQLEYIASMDKNDGFIMYAYKNIFTTTGKINNRAKEEVQNFLPTLKAFGE